MNLALSFRTFCSLTTTRTTNRTSATTIGNKKCISSPFLLPTQKHISQLTLSSQSLHTTSIPTVSAWNYVNNHDTTSNNQITSFSTQAMKRPLSSLCLNQTNGQPSSIVPYMTKNHNNNITIGSQFLLPLASSFSTLVRNNMTNSLNTYNPLKTTQHLTRIAPNNTSSTTSTIGSIRFFASKRHKRLLKRAKGYRGRSKNCFTVAIRRVEKAWQYSYRDRKNKHRLYRQLWIMRIQAGVRQYNLNYSRFIHHLIKTNCHLNRKVLAELAMYEPFSFKSVVDVVQHQVKQQKEQLQEKNE